MMYFMRIFFVVSLVLLSSCANPHVQKARKWAHDLYYGPPKKHVVIVLKKSDERWCYSTLGEVECYQKPQRLPPESLVAVEPAKLFPKSNEEYYAAIEASEALKTKKIVEKPIKKTTKTTKKKSNEPMNIRSLIK